MTEPFSPSRQCDVVVVGGSLGGCATAALFARRGLKVVVLERRHDAAAYKKVCTHFIQPSATPVLRRLGLADRIEAAGGIRNRLRVWTRWGWIKDSAEAGDYGYNVRRQTLDPLVRQWAMATPGVRFTEGTVARGLLREGAHVVGVQAETGGRAFEVRARLVVAADGWQSRFAESAGFRSRATPNGRFTYFALFRNVALSKGASAQYWHLEPNLAYAFVNDGDTTLLGAFLPLARVQDWKRDVEGSFLRFWEAVPDGPRLKGAVRTTEMRGMLALNNVWRRVAGRGLALVGDAALTLDPIWGTGCGFAFQSAEWLVESTADALVDRPHSLHALARGLARYRARHLWATRGHALHIADFSRVRRNRRLETLVFSAATRDVRTARRVLSYLGRQTGLSQLLSPASVSRAAWVNLKHRWRSGTAAERQSGEPTTEVSRAVEP
jgi:2-polyprenyl-6-methoxyphenol hydroxylase-like FAD-dependent oxidoreductase